MRAGGPEQCRVVVVHSPADRRFASLLKRDLDAAGAECRLVEHEGYLAQALAEATSAAGVPPWLIALLSPAALGDRTLHAAVEAGLRLVLRGPVPFVVEPFDPRLLPPGWAQLEGFDGSVRYIEAQRGLCALLGLRSARGQEWIAAEPTTTLAALRRPEERLSLAGSIATGAPRAQVRTTAAPPATPSPAQTSPQGGEPAVAPSPARLVSRRSLLGAGAGLGALALLGAGAVLAGRIGDAAQGQDTGPSGPRLRWTSTLHSPVSASLIAEAGTVYAASDEGALHAVSALNGALLWRFARPVPMRAGPASTHGLVYAGWADGLVAALNTQDGTQRWTFHVGGEVNAILATAGGVVYVSGDDRHLYALDARGGQLLWKRLLPYGGLTTPAVAGDMVFVSGAGAVTALDAPTGELIWEYPTAVRGPYFTAPAAQGDAVYVGSWDFTLYALAVADGSLMWSFRTRDQVRTQPATAGGMVYISSLDTRVYAIDAASGKQLWSFLTYGPADVAPTPNTTAPVVNHETVYLGTERTEIFALSAADGTPRWTFRTDSPVRAAPAFTSELVIFAATDGTLYGFAP